MAFKQREGKQGAASDIRPLDATWAAEQLTLNFEESRKARRQRLRRHPLDAHLAELVMLASRPKGSYRQLQRFLQRVTGTTYDPAVIRRFLKSRAPHVAELRARPVERKSLE